MPATGRFLDAKDEYFQHPLPIPDFANIPILSLEDALHPIKGHVRKVDSIAKKAKKRSSKPKDNLTIDESAAICLFTVDQTEEKESVCVQLNQALRSEDGNHLEPWSPYLKLLLTALDKLPSTSCRVYRGVRADVREQYHYEHICWRGVSNCSRSKAQIEKYLGKKDARTLFEINCINGKLIGNHSYLNDDNEIILMPGIYLRVSNILEQTNGIYMIRLQEVSAPDDLNQSHKIKESSKVHPAYQFRAAQPWFDRQFHSKGSRSIVKPNELEASAKDPPERIELEIFNRIHGSIIGMSLGDALGAHVEFRPHEFLLQHPVKGLEGGGTWGLEKGQFTDDTSMALCLACSLIVCQDFVPYDQLVRYKWWNRDGYMSSTGVCFDIGAATQQSILKFEQRQKRFAQTHNIPADQLDFLSDSELLEKFNVYCSEDGVAGNGALMRLAPVPLFFYQYPQYAVQFSGQSGLITHGDRKAYDACRYYGALIVAALRGESKADLLDDDFYRKHKDWFNNEPLTEEIKQIAQGSYKRKSGYEEGIRGKGYIVNALEAALWAFYNDKDSFEKGALAAVNLGDDTDTTAAIYGQLAGAYYGFENLPKKWADKVYAKNFLNCLSKWVTYEGNKWRPNRSIRANDSMESSRPQNADANIKTAQTPDTNLLKVPSQAPPVAKRLYPPEEQKSNNDRSHDKNPVSNETANSVASRRDPNPTLCKK
ncbi:unnamed protein product, partial [Adineta steineri]